MKCAPCFYCGIKPKCYRDDGEWYLDHMCIVQDGHAYFGGLVRATLVRAWNAKVMRDVFACAERLKENAQAAKDTGAPESTG